MRNLNKLSWVFITLGLVGMYSLFTGWDSEYFDNLPYHSSNSYFLIFGIGWIVSIFGTWLAIAINEDWMY